jgi:hypothetical protein
MTVMWLRCHPFLMGHSRRHLAFDWLDCNCCVHHDTSVPGGKLQVKTWCLLLCSGLVIVIALRCVSDIDSMVTANEACGCPSD